MPSRDYPVSANPVFWPLSETLYFPVADHARGIEGCASAECWRRKCNNSASIGEPSAPPRASMGEREAS